MVIKCIVCEKTQPSFNLPGERATHCGKCRLPGMINVISTKCIVCKNGHSLFGYFGKSRATHCNKCKEPDMINVREPRCIVCEITQPTFNLPGKLRATHCNKCKEPNMIDVKSFKCIVCKIIQPRFNLPDQLRATHCNKCKEPNMINIKDRKCIVCKKTRPNFNYPGEKAAYCNKCKKPDMIDVKNPRCVVCKKTQPAFNLPGEKPTHCAKCKESSMINTQSRKCIICKETHPTFNYPGEKATHCTKCKEPSMINVKSRKCIVCKETRPSFNLPNESNPTHCSKCRLHDMVNVTHIKCSVCNTRASYGIPCNVPSRCTKHKDEGMIMNPRSKCRIKSCNNTARYGVSFPLHCELHIKDNDIDLVERKCIKCGKLDILNEKKLCMNFCVADEKYKMYQKHQKRDENRILELLVKNIEQQPTLTDSIVQNDCGDRERPDIIYDCKTHHVIVEIDEHQHKQYCTDGDVKRMKNIFMNQYGGSPVIFIRYNPHSFKDDKNTQVKIPQTERETTLIKWVKKLMTDIPQYLCSVVYLFYDGYTLFDKRKWVLEIDPYDMTRYNCNICQSEFFLNDLFQQHIKYHKKTETGKLFIKTKTSNKIVTKSLDKYQEIVFD